MNLFYFDISDEIINFLQKLVNKLRGHQTFAHCRCNSFDFCQILNAIANRLTKLAL